MDIIPASVARPDFSLVQRMVVTCIAAWIKDKQKPKDFEHYVFEEVMEAVYGRGCWDWYNQLLDDTDE